MGGQVSPASEAEGEPASGGSLVYFTHDVRYLYAGIRALLALGGTADSSRLIQRTGDDISRYNEKRALDFQLGKSRPVREEVLRDVVGELSLLGVVTLEDKTYRFTELGHQMSQYLRNRESESLKLAMLKLMLSQYPEMITFITSLDRAGTGGVIELPLVNSHLVNELAHGEVETLAKIMADVLSDGPNRVHVTAEQIEQELVRRLPAQPNKLKAAKSALDTVIIQSMFGGDVQSRRKFDVLRSREQFFNLVNHGTANRGESFFDQTYLTSWIDPGMTIPRLPGSLKDVELDGRTLRIHVMEDSHANLRDFEAALTSAYRSVPRSQGFALASDLRDFVCRELRISAENFADLFETLYRAQPRLVKLDYSFDVFTRKRLPLRMSGDGSLYNLVRVTTGVN